MIKTFLTASLLLLVSVQVNASLINNASTVLDSNSTLEWLDLTETDSMNYADAFNSYTADGWQHATESQFESMFDSNFTEYSGNAFGYETVYAGSAGYDQALLFHSFFGSTEGGSSYGYYEDSGGVLRLGGVDVHTNSNSANVYRDYYASYEAPRSDRTNGNFQLGVFLVRDVSISSVPTPPALLLFFTGILGLGVSRYFPKRRVAS